MDNLRIPCSTTTPNPCKIRTPTPLETNKVVEIEEKGKSFAGRRFLGVRQRPSGRWVAEIKDSSQKLRLWLGTFDRPEEAAMAYDSAAMFLRGRNAKTNFTYHGSVMSNIHQQNCKFLGKNPRVFQLLQQHAVMKNHARSGFLGSLTNINPWENHDQNNFNTLVEETIVCSSNSEDELHGLSFGSSKVYSSVFVAPSFSASGLCQGGEEKDSNCKTT